MRQLASSVGKGSKYTHLHFQGVKESQAPCYQHTDEDPLACTAADRNGLSDPSPAQMASLVMKMKTPSSHQMAHPSWNLPVVACPGMAADPRERSCTLFSAECSSSSDFDDHRPLGDSESFAVGSGLSRVSCSALCTIAGHTNRMLLRFDDSPTCYVFSLPATQGAPRQKRDLARSEMT